MQKIGATMQVRGTQTSYKLVGDRQIAFQRVYNAPRERVKRIFVEAHGGDDRVGIARALNRVPVTVLGGAGNDLLQGGQGKDVLIGRCFACHGFQSRMASVKHDANGWIDRVNYMRGTMHFFLDSAQPFTDQNAEDVATYMNFLFGEKSILPESPADIPAYKGLVRSFSDDAMKIVYVQYELPNRNRFAWSAVPAKDGTFVVPYYGTANRIARLNPTMAAVEEYRVPHLGTAAIHSAVPAPDESNFYYTAALDPARLVTGSNVVAVEVHQNATNSSDLSFDLQLLAFQADQHAAHSLRQRIDGGGMGAPVTADVIATDQGHAGVP